MFYVLYQFVRVLFHADCMSACNIDSGQACTRVYLLLS